MSMDGIGSHDADRSGIIFISAGEVSYVDKCAEIGMCDSIDQLFNTVCVLREESVILNAGFDALCLSIFGNGSVALNKTRKCIVKALAVITLCKNKAGCCVMTHELTAISRCDINSALDTLDFLLEIAV